MKLVNTLKKVILFSSKVCSQIFNFLPKLLTKAFSTKTTNELNLFLAKNILKKLHLKLYTTRKTSQPTNSFEEQILGSG